MILKNTAWVAIGLVALAAAAGCDKRPVMRISEPVGPEPASTLAAVDGDLVVFTDVEQSRELDYGPSVRSAYKILDMAGGTVEIVDDDSLAPKRVRLEPGNYVIRGPGFGRTVEIPVRIVAGETTEVRIDGSTPAEEPAQSREVRAPDGQFIGFAVSR